MKIIYNSNKLLVSSKFYSIIVIIMWKTIGKLNFDKCIKSFSPLNTMIKEQLQDRIISEI